jgi:glutamyl/glutaminyl-tRNA synthetase
LLSALLVWLDARSRGDRALLRFEDVDHTRCTPALHEQMRRDLAWFGLDWDGEVLQSELRPQHEAALDRLQRDGRLYPCHCSRSQRRGSGRRAPDGGLAYDNLCRDRTLPAGGWRAADAAVRVRLPDDLVEIRDDSGVDLSQRPSHEMGDPIVLRRDGALAYHLVVVVDDGASAVDRIVRGRDLAPCTATHVALQRLLHLPTPAYRHHFLFLEPRGDKLAKLHGAVGAPALRARYTRDELCGLLAHAAGLRPDDGPCHPHDLLADFSWARVAQDDRVLAWRDGRLVLDAEPGR